MKKIFLEGNDGTGKTSAVEFLRGLGYEAFDRSGLSETTLDDVLRIEENAIYIVLECPVEMSLQRLQEAGKDMNEEWHTEESLRYFLTKFREVGAEYNAIFISSAGSKAETQGLILKAIKDYV